MLKWVGIILLSIISLSCTNEQEEGFFSKESTNVGLTCSATESQNDEVKVKAIYGVDNRLDWFESPGETKNYWAKATVALIPSNHLVKEGESFRISATSYGDSVNLCPGQPFEDQPSAAHCSGFLVSEDLVVTAGHCVRDQIDCYQSLFVFDYAKVSENQKDFYVPESSVYGCEEVVHSEVGARDFSIVRLDRSVLDRTPLNVRRSGQLSRGDQVMLIGHPMGLPSKIADGGFVQTVGNVIEASVDAFAANSGSVILNSVTGIAEGILVAGEADFSFKDGCRVEAICGNNCQGEVITPIQLVLPYIPDVYYENPICTIGATKSTFAK